MSGMLHPVGPEPARTYWVRRGILLAVVLVLALGIVLAVASLTKAAVATAPPPVIAPVDTPSPSTPTANPSPAASTSTPTSPGTATASTPSATPSASPSPSGSVSASTSTSARPTATPAKPTPAGTPDCKPGDLAAALTGDRTLSPGQDNTFKVSLANGGAQTCLASVTDKSFELKIYSGKDRIWSSRDCAKVLDDFDKKLAAKAAVQWTMTWNGQRSVEGKSCKRGTGTPQPGTYWATAQLKGAEPVQLRMIIS